MNLKQNKLMLTTTTPHIEGKRIVQYYGIVTGETIIGANMFRDFFAGIRDIVGGRSGAYEEVLRQAKDGLAGNGRPGFPTGSQCGGRGRFGL